MANLQNALIAERGINKFIGFFERRRHRLLDKHVNSLLHQTAAGLCVRNRGNGHARSVHCPAQFAERTKSARPKFRSEFFRSRSIGIEHATSFAPSISL